jgi:hypothetical protein
LPRFFFDHIDPGLIGGSVTAFEAVSSHIIPLALLSKRKSAHKYRAPSLGFRFAEWSALCLGGHQLRRPRHLE